MCYGNSCTIVCCKLFAAASWFITVMSKIYLPINFTLKKWTVVILNVTQTPSFSAVLFQEFMGQNIQIRPFRNITIQNLK